MSNHVGEHQAVPCHKLFPSASGAMVAIADIVAEMADLQGVWAQGSIKESIKDNLFAALCGNAKLESA